MTANDKPWIDEDYTSSEELISFILAKSAATAQKEILKDELVSLYHDNDGCMVEEDDLEYINRAQVVKQSWLNNIVRLLK